MVNKNIVSKQPLVNAGDVSGYSHKYQMWLAYVTSSISN